MGKMAQIKIPSPRHRAQTPISQYLLHKHNPSRFSVLYQYSKSSRRGSSGCRNCAAISRLTSSLPLHGEISVPMPLHV